MKGIKISASNKIFRKISWQFNFSYILYSTLPGTNRAQILKHYCSSNTGFYLLGYLRLRNDVM